MTSQAVTTSQPARREPTSTSLALSTALSIAHNALVGNAGIPADKLPTGARLGLETRQRELTAALDPAGPDRIRRILFTLEDMAARNEADPAMARYSADRDVADLSDMPEWALERAARAYRRAEVGDGRWRPTAGELRAYASRLIDPLRAERAKIGAVLSAKVIEVEATIDRARRGQLADMLRQAGSDFQARDVRPLRAPPPRPETSAEARANLDRLAAMSSAPLTVSPYLRAKLNPEERESA